MWALVIALEYWVIIIFWSSCAYHPRKYFFNIIISFIVSPLSLQAQIGHYQAFLHIFKFCCSASFTSYIFRIHSCSLLGNLALFIKKMLVIFIFKPFPTLLIFIDITKINLQQTFSAWHLNIGPLLYCYKICL